MWPRLNIRLMKMNSIFSTTLLLVTVFAVTFTSCKKEQTAATSDATAAASAENNHMVVVNGSGLYSGSIKASYASSLAANYAKQYGSDNSQTQSVAFSAKDLIAFLSGLQTKYKSDIIYVNFGVYGKGALPLNSKDNGRLTVFFTGNKIPAPSANRRNDDIGDDGSMDEYLNHGSMLP